MGDQQRDEVVGYIAQKCIDEINGHVKTAEAHGNKERALRLIGIMLAIRQAEAKPVERG